MTAEVKTTGPSPAQRWALTMAGEIGPGTFEILVRLPDGRWSYRRFWAESLLEAYIDTGNEFADRGGQAVWWRRDEEYWALWPGLASPEQMPSDVG